MIYAREFIRNYLNDRQIVSGLWLGSMLIKPQVLILIVPALFLMKNWKQIIGYVGSSVFSLVRVS